MLYVFFDLINSSVFIESFSYSIVGVSLSKPGFFEYGHIQSEK